MRGNTDAAVVVRGAPYNFVGLRNDGHAAQPLILFRQNACTVAGCGGEDLDQIRQILVFFKWIVMARPRAHQVHHIDLGMQTENIEGRAFDCAIGSEGFSDRLVAPKLRLCAGFPRDTHGFLRARIQCEILAIQLFARVELIFKGDHERAGLALAGEILDEDVEVLFGARPDPSFFSTKVSDGQTFGGLDALELDPIDTDGSYGIRRIARKRGVLRPR